VNTTYTKMHGATIKMDYYLRRWDAMYSNRYTRNSKPTFRNTPELRLYSLWNTVLCGWYPVAIRAEDEYKSRVGQSQMYSKNSPFFYTQRD